MSNIEPSPHGKPQANAKLTLITLIGALLAAALGLFGWLSLKEDVSLDRSLQDMVGAGLGSTSRMIEELPGEPGTRSGSFDRPTRP